MFVSSMLMNCGFYALIPYLAVHLKEDLLWTATLVGLLLGVRQMSQQGLMFLTGVLADRVGYRFMIVVGMFVRGIGFSLFGVFDSPPGMFFAAIIAALGGAMFEPTKDAALTVLTPPEMRSRVFAIKKTVTQGGILLAAVVSAFLMSLSIQALAFFSGGIFLFLALLTFLRLPTIQVQDDKKLPFRQMWKTVLRDRHFLALIVIVTGYWFLFMQIFMTIPMQAIAITGNDKAISLVNSVLAVVILLGQYPINRLMTRFSVVMQVFIGLASMGAGVLVLGTTHSLTVFLIGFLFFASGSMVVEPANYEITTKLAKKELTATYFGFSYLAMAFGGGFGQSGSGWLLEVGERIGSPTLLWWISAGVAMLSMVGIVLLGRAMRRKEAREQTMFGGQEKPLPLG
ncbi:MAG TPA: MFS transporter [Bacilli bacterium]|nr:MFS transporter [Bacilli bacterium]